jgi:hypothetical protein
MSDTKKINDYEESIRRLQEENRNFLVQLRYTHEPKKYKEISDSIQFNNGRIDFFSNEIEKLRTLTKDERDRLEEERHKEYYKRKREEEAQRRIQEEVEKGLREETIRRNQEKQYQKAKTEREMLEFIRRVEEESRQEIERQERERYRKDKQLDTLYRPAPAPAQAPPIVSSATAQPLYPVYSTPTSDRIKEALRMIPAPYRLPEAHAVAPPSYRFPEALATGSDAASASASASASAPASAPAPAPSVYRTPLPYAQTAPPYTAPSKESEALPAVWIRDAEGNIVLAPYREGMRKKYEEKYMKYKSKYNKLKKVNKK